MAETIDTILERMLLQIPSRYDTSSGTYTYDIEKSTATEFENVYDIIAGGDIGIKHRTLKMNLFH